jgi:glycosyltransferase involved in cell wall biosynthesis
MWTRTYAPRVVPQMIRAATRVIAVSEFTAREAEELLGVSRERISVVPNGVEPVFTREGPKADGDYVLAVGTLEPRKNLQRTIAAAKRVGVELRVVGERGWGRVDAGVDWQGRVGDEELARLYRGARCLVYPSHYEGFGIPVAEALACGTPVVTSRGSAMEEVAGDAAVLVDPLDVSSIAAGIAEATSRPVDGFEVPTWDDAARLTVEVYREAAG